MELLLGIYRMAQRRQGFPKSSELPIAGSIQAETKQMTTDSNWRLELEFSFQY